MSNAIKINAEKAPERYDLGASKFFGTPTVPAEWVDGFYDNEIFLCQIRLSDIAALDNEGRLPKTGYLYVFLRVNEENDFIFEPVVRYYDGEPTHALEEFNSAIEGFEAFDTAYLMRFSEAEEDADGTRLFGVPSGWQYGDEPPALFMQFDPLDSEMGFLDSLDGYLYFFFGDDEGDLSKITLLADYS